MFVSLKYLVKLGYLGSYVAFTATEEKWTLSWCLQRQRSAVRHIKYSSELFCHSRRGGERICLNQILNPNKLLLSRKCIFKTINVGKIISVNIICQQESTWLWVQCKSNNLMLSSVSTHRMLLSIVLCNRSAQTSLSHHRCYSCWFLKEETWVVHLDLWL